MDLAGIITFIVLIVTMSLSGVLMPGPVTALTLARGQKSPHAGAWVSIGHGAVELPLMAGIYFGAGGLFSMMPIKAGVGIVGGAVMLWMGIGMLRGYKKVEVTRDERKVGTGSTFWAGAALSLANPYFLVWWATAGAALISQSLKFGLMGFIILVAVHWLCDLIWYYLLGALSYRGSEFFGNKLQQGVFIVCGLALIYFSGYFLIGAVMTITGTS